MKVKITDNLDVKFPYSLGELKRDYPNVSFPRSPSIATFEAYGVYDVVELDAPTVDPTTHKVVRETTPVNVDGTWTLSWTVVEKTATEIESYNNALIAKYTDAIQTHLDSLAQQRGYDNIISACTYATSQNSTFSAEGIEALALRDNVWTYATAELPKFLSGVRAVPTVAEFIAELPVWGA